MRSVLIPLVLVLAPACEREPSFEERYAATQKRIDAKSGQLDAELAGQPAARPDKTSGSASLKVVNPPE